MGVAVGHGWASATKAQELALGAFLELLELAIGVHLLATIDVVDGRLQGVANGTIEPATRHHLARRENGDMAITAMASVVDGVLVGLFGNLEQSLLVEEERPEMVFQVEGSPTILVLFKLFPHDFEEIAILLWLYMGALVGARGAIAPEGKHIHVLGHHEVYNVGNLPYIRARDGCHDGASQAIPADYVYFLYRGVETTRLANEVVRLAHPVDRKLIFLTPVFLQSLAHLVGEVEGVSEDGKGNIPPFQYGQNSPKILMQDRVATRDVEVGQAFHFLAHILASVDDLLGAFERHLDELGMPLGEDVAMLATLVATIGDMPLKSEIFHLLL